MSYSKLLKGLLGLWLYKASVRLAPEFAERAIAQAILESIDRRSRVQTSGGTAINSIIWQQRPQG